MCPSPTEQSVVSTEPSTLDCCKILDPQLLYRETVARANAVSNDCIGMFDVNNDPAHFDVDLIERCHCFDMPARWYAKPMSLINHSLLFILSTTGYSMRITELVEISASLGVIWKPEQQVLISLGGRCIGARSFAYSLSDFRGCSWQA